VKRVAFLVDNPYRDLPGLILVAMRLCSEGTTCYLVPMNLMESELSSLEVDFILLSCLRTKNEAFVKKLQEAGVQVGVLDVEGGVYTPAAVEMTEEESTQKNTIGSLAGIKQYALTMASDPHVRGNVSRFFSWGTQFAEYASQVGWYRSDQIAVTGVPRFDFYAPPWRSASLRVTNHAEGVKEPVVLLNASFPLANPSREDPEWQKVHVMKYFSYRREYLDRLHALQKEAMAGLVVLANTLARNFPEVSFVFRPHPFEKSDTYRALLEPHPNLHLIQYGTVDGWLLRAKTMIMWNSSTAIEAGLAGIPTLFPTWIAKYLPVPTVEAASIPCASKESLFEMLRAILEGRFEPPKPLREKFEIMVKGWFYEIDGRSHQRVASEILKCLEYSQGNGSRSLSLKRVLEPRLEENGALRGKVASRLRKFLGLPSHWSLRHWGPLIEHQWMDYAGKFFDEQSVRVWTEVLYEESRSDAALQLKPVRVERVQHRVRLGNRCWGRTVVLSPAGGK